jgi:hypothetical protein
LKYEYKISNDVISHKELGVYNSYGISSNYGYKISDISTDKKQVEKLIARINEKQTPREYLPYEIDVTFNENF